jgi:hypothetical protein
VLHSFRRDASLIQSVSQHRELRCSQTNNAITDRRPSDRPWSSRFVADADKVRIDFLYGLYCYPDLEVGERRSLPPLTADNTVESVAASTLSPTRICTRKPLSRSGQRHRRPADIISVRFACAFRLTALDTWRPAARAPLHLVARSRPSSKPSATIRAFSSAVHRRRRRCPVTSSTRRYAPSCCPA